ncbi:DNA-binding ferritin-like protein (Dps family) [Crossiella equi]|uniref:DNA-binding ferritin-like protein (Dps family) n=1 Tax=Crossiella equi TaxID=130796 RepID=A0ABS5A5Z0_9PSEU|nr:DUF1048 domain-containing protein [Crossiella equi]MBP2471657.1 DNA-binding ferritin-like protein (Dps family) [Crossiella equi]
MSFWETVTGSDLTREWKAFEARAAVLPEDHRAAWEEIKTHLMPAGDFTGRNLTPILDGALGLLEESAAEGQSAREVLGEDVKGFCLALTGGKGEKTFRDRWREQLNRNVARKLGKLGG